MAIEAPTFQKPIIPDIFPLGSDVIVNVVRPVREIDEPADRYLQEKMKVLENENPYANQMLLSLPSQVEPPRDKLFMLGVVFAYEAYKQRAVGTRLPVLTLEFVQDFYESREERLDSMYQGQADDKYAEEVNVVRGLFAMLEKDAYKTLETETVEKGRSLFNTHIYLGFVYSYFLFREGFSNPANWE